MGYIVPRYPNRWSGSNYLFELSTKRSISGSAGKAGRKEGASGLHLPVPTNPDQQLTQPAGAFGMIGRCEKLRALRSIAATILLMCGQRLLAPLKLETQSACL